MCDSTIELKDMIDLEAFGLIPEEVQNAADEALEGLLPQKSKGRYEVEYKNLEIWMAKMKVNVVSETVLLAYFNEMVGILIKL